MSVRNRRSHKGAACFQAEIQQKINLFSPAFHYLWRLAPYLAEQEQQWGFPTQALGSLGQVISPLVSLCLLRAILPQSPVKQSKKNRLLENSAVIIFL